MSNAVMILDFPLVKEGNSTVGGGEESVKKILSLTKEGEVTWHCISPVEVGLVDTLVVHLGESRYFPISPQQQTLVRNWINRLHPTLILLIQPRGRYIYSIFQSLPNWAKEVTRIRWGSMVDSPLIQKPNESFQSFKERQEDQKSHQLIQQKMGCLSKNLVVSKSLGESLQRIGIPKERITLIPNIVLGISNSLRLSKEEELKQKYLGENCLGVLIASRVVRTKGLHWIPLVLRKLVELKIKTRVKFTLVGEARDEAFLRELVNESDVVCKGDELKFEYKGVKNSEELTELYNSYDILFHPSPSEGYPRVIVEAALSEMTIIGNLNCHSVREIISGADQPIGLLADSAEEAAAQIKLLAENKFFLKELQKNSLSWAEVKFAPQSIVKEFWRAIEGE